MDVRIGKFRLKDGTELHYEHWSPLKFDRVIVLVHGLGDHCGRYGPFVDYFTKRETKVCIYDQRGHGRSAGEKVYVENFEIFSSDLEEYISFSRTNGASHLPWFLVGHSMGGQVVLNFLTRGPNIFKAACVSSPNLGVVLPIPAWKEVLGRKLLKIVPTFKLKGFSRPEWLSHEPKVALAYAKDPLIASYVTVGLGNEVLNNIEILFQKAPQIQTPLLLLHGLVDRYCSAEATKRFFNELVLAEKELKLYEGMYHELFNELNKERVFEEIDYWFQKFA